MITPGGGVGEGRDPFGAAGLRRAVLDAWAASPDRFREDANAEEDLALGGYRDRVVVELAQNAADAAARAGEPGRLLLRLDDGDPPGSGPRLVAANTGAPLDAAGVRALASLRASAKRDEAGAAGRFGVGSAAVLAVADDVLYATAGGDGVRFSREDARAALAPVAAAVPALAAEVARRDGAVPVLRLPRAVPVPAATVPDGYATAVVLALRDAAAVTAVTAQLDALDDALLLALPALGEVVVEVPGRPARRLAGAQERWHVLRRSGPFDAGALADRPTEERQRLQRTGWSLAWALPRDAGRREALRREGVVHAPTPTAERLAWPALLVATLPVEPSRRAVAPGPATDAVLAAAGAAWADLLAERAHDGEDVLPLVPAGLGAGALDAGVREAALAALAGAPVLPAVEDGVPLRPRDAVALEGALGDDPVVLAALAPLVAGLVRAPSAGAAAAAVRALGVRRLPLADLVDALAPGGAPAAWAARVGALAGAAADPAVAEQLAVLPVPLAGGRTARGVRGLLLPAAGLPAGALDVLAGHGLAVVDAAAAADPGAAALLVRLGARTATARAVLEDPAVAAAVLAAADAAEDDADDAEAVAEEVAGAVLALVAAGVADGDLRPGDLPALAELPLPDAEGELVPAAGLVLPGSPAADLLDPEEVGVVTPALLERWGAGVLEAAGVARGLAVLRWADVDPGDPPDDLTDLDGADRWLAGLADLGGPGAVAAEVVAVRDLDLVPPAARGALLRAVATDPALRAAVLEPVRLVDPAGGVREAPSLTAAWLGRRLGLRGRAAPGAPPGLAALLPPAGSVVADAAVVLDPALATAAGMVTGWADLDAGAWQRLLDALSDAAAPLPAVVDLLAMWRALAAAAPDVHPPARVAALGADGAPVLADAEDAVVVDDPAWAQRADLGPHLVPGAVGAAALADVLDLDLASERAPGRVDGPGEPVPVPQLVAAVLPGAPATWRRHPGPGVVVDGVRVGWWVTGTGPDAVVHAAAGPGLARDLGRGLARAAGAWPRRALAEALLRDDADADALLVEDAAG